MEEPFVGTMTMGERSHHPQVLRSKGNAVRGQGSRSGGSGITGGAAKQAAGYRPGAGPARAKRPVKETACDAPPS